MAIALYVIGRGLQSLAGLGAFIWGLIVAHEVFGVPGVLLGIVLIPLTILLGPIYAAFAWGYWLLLVAPFAASIAGALLIALAARLAPAD
jgi:hypothetical protein